MPLRLTYLFKNLTRNKLRTCLTCAAVALPIIIFVLSMSVVDGLDAFLENSAKQLRMVVTQKTSIINPLPEGHRRKIESLDPDRKSLLAVCGIRYIGGQRKDEALPLSTLAVDPDTFRDCFPEHHITDAEWGEWTRDRRAIMVGRGTAADLGWKTGDRINIFPSIPPYQELEFKIVSTLPDADDFVTNWCRRDYIEEIIQQAGAPGGQVTFLFIKCKTAADIETFRRGIDEHFAGAMDETKTQDEKTFMNEFISQQFDLPTNLRILAALTVLVAISAAANTMSMNFRDRINEIATLKSLGFSGAFAFFLIQTESLLLCGLGGLLGALGPYIAFTYTPMKNLTVPLIQTLVIEPETCLKALAVALLIGILAAAWPSLLASRMTPVSALRALE